MALKAVKKDIAGMAEVLDADYDSLEDAAAAALSWAWSQYENKAGWVVVGRIAWDGYADWEPGRPPRVGTEDGAWLDPRDWKDSRIVLGPFSTETQAENARQSLVWSSTTGEEFATWVFPFAPGMTPAAFFGERKADKKRLMAMGDDERSRYERALKRRQDFFALHGHVNFPDDIDEEVPRCTKCGQKLEEEAAQ